MLLFVETANERSSVVEKDAYALFPLAASSADEWAVTVIELTLRFALETPFVSITIWLTSFEREPLP